MDVEVRQQARRRDLLATCMDFNIIIETIPEGESMKFSIVLHTIITYIHFS